MLQTKQNTVMNYQELESAIYKGYLTQMCLEELHYDLWIWIKTPAFFFQLQIWHWSSLSSEMYAS